MTLVNNWIYLTFNRTVLIQNINKQKAQKARKISIISKWQVHQKEDDLKSGIIKALKSDGEYLPRNVPISLINFAKSHLHRISIRCRIPANNDNLLKFCASCAIHHRKLAGQGSYRRIALTTLTAKNQEFDHVHVIWDDHVLGGYSEDRQRRHLYNAITRAKCSCKVVVIGDAGNINNHPVLSLLGKVREPMGRKQMLGTKKLLGKKKDPKSHKRGYV